MLCLPSPHPPLKVNGISLHLVGKIWIQSLAFRSLHLEEFLVKAVVSSSVWNILKVFHICCYKICLATFLPCWLMGQLVVLLLFSFIGPITHQVKPSHCKIKHKWKQNKPLLILGNKILQSRCSSEGHRPLDPLLNFRSFCSHSLKRSKTGQDNP